MQWDTLGGNFNANQVSSMIYYQNKLFVAGGFHSANGGSTICNGIAYWNNNHWEALNQAFLNNGHPHQMRKMNSLLYVTGAFDSVNTILSADAVIWNDTDWISMGVQNAYHGGLGQANDIAYFNNEFYLAGNFHDSAFTVFDFCKWNGNLWERVDTNLSGNFASLAIYHNELYLAGAFIGGAPGINIVKYDGTNFTSVGGDIQGTQVNRLKVINDKLFAVGLFTSAGGVPACNIAIWDGSNWSALSSDFFDYDINDIEIYNNQLFVAGAFQHINGVPINFIAIYTGDLGIKDLNEPALDFYLTPNPSNTSITISISNSLIEDVLMTTTDALCKKQLHVFIPKQTIRKELDISELAAGVYFVTLESESGKVTKKFIVH
ncbi:MAG: T9SS type A sorting domain-containing protein [Bacteroidota bacterium]